jgi:hypothetical protein
MNFDVILGVSIVLPPYGLMWYLVLKSRKIIETIDKKDPGHTEATRHGTENKGGQEKQR